MKHKHELTESDITRKQKDLQDKQDYCDEVEFRIETTSLEAARLREEKLLQVECIRRTFNQNKLYEYKIQQLKKLIEELILSFDNTKQVTNRKIAENEDVIADINLLMRFITTLEEQNRELDGELDKFVQCDNEIRQKLLDRERSPLRLKDLYHGKHAPESKYEAPKYNPPKVSRTSTRVFDSNT